jgi:hypothetical protein
MGPSRHSTHLAAADRLPAFHPHDFPPTDQLCLVRFQLHSAVTELLLMPRTNHLSLFTNPLPLSPFDALALAQGRPLTSLSDIALATSDHGRSEPSARGSSPPGNLVSSVREPTPSEQGQIHFKPRVNPFKTLVPSVKIRRASVGARQ